jgi:cysteine desulfurase family protein (TIGR01976 family)
MPLDRQAVTSLRAEFPALGRSANGRPAVFFDGPGGTQAHGSVIETMRQYFTVGNSYSHGAFSLSHVTDDVVSAAREALCAFVNANGPDEIVFGPNMTTLTFQASRAFGRTLRKGDEIVVTQLDHDANVAPWLALQEQGAVIREVGFRADDCTLDLSELKSSITHRTKLVAVGYASNAVGTLNDVRAIAEMAHAVGARIYVDAVHYAPHGPTDVQALDCDFLVCSAHKFFGPHLGVLYGRRELLETLPAYKIRPASERAPDRFETGTLPFDALAGATAAVGYLASVGQRFGDWGNAAAGDRTSSVRSRLEAGFAAIRSYETALCGQLLSGLAQIAGIRVYGIRDVARLVERVPTVSFTVEGRDARDVAERLDERGIFVWDGTFYAQGIAKRLDLEAKGGLVRVGLAHYSLPEEVERLLEALAGLKSETARTSR